MVVDLRRADAREVGPGAECAVQHRDIRGRDDCVGVQEQDVGARAQPVGECDVHAGGEAAVAARIEVPHTQLIAQRRDLGQGRVVDHRDGEGGHRLEGAAEQAGRAVGDHHDLHLGRGVGCLVPHRAVQLR